MGLGDANLVAGVVRAYVRGRGWQVDTVGGVLGWLASEDMQDPECGVTKWAQPESALTVGQMVVVAKKTGGASKHNIALSMRPSDCHAGLSWVCPPTKNQVLLVTVTAVEDHGYSCSLGRSTRKHDMKVFVRKPKTAGSEALRVGQTLLVVVDAVKKESKLLLCREEAMERYISIGTATDVSRLIPGQLVECRVATLEYSTGAESSSVAGADNDGLPRKKRQRVTTPDPSAGRHKLETLTADRIKALTVHVCASVAAEIPSYHRHNAELTRCAQQGEISSKLASSVFPYNERDEQLGLSCPSFTKYRDTSFLARVIALEGKSVFVSVLPHWVNWNYPLALQDRFRQRVGTLVKNLTVAYRKERGMILAAGWIEGTSDFDSFYRCAKKQYTEADLLWQQQRPGKTHALAKCLEFWLADCYGMITLKKEMMEETRIVTLEDARPGRVVNVAVEKVGENYVLCKLDKGMRCRLFREFVGNVALKNLPPKMFQPGHKFEARILRANPATAVIELTKKSVHMNLEPEDVELQTAFHKTGVVDTIFELVVVLQGEKGLLLRGFGDCVVFLPYADIAVNELERSEMTQELTDEIMAAKRYQPGAVLKVRVIRINPLRKATASLDLVSPLSKFSHRGPEKSAPAAVLSFEDINVGDTIPAVVTNVLPATGVFIKFEGSQISALARPAEALEEDEDEITLQKGDAVLAKVLAKDLELKRINVGLKSSYFGDLAASGSDDESMSDSAAAALVDRIEAADSDDPVSDVAESDVEMVSDAEEVSEVEAVSDDQEEEEEGAGAEEAASDAEDVSEAEVVSDPEDGSEAEPVSEAEVESDPEDGVNAESDTNGERSNAEEAARSAADGSDQTETAPESEEEADSADEDGSIYETTRTLEEGSTGDLPTLERMVLVEGDKPMPWVQLMAYWAEHKDLAKSIETAYRAMKVIPLEEKLKREDIWKALLNIVIELSTDAEQRVGIVKEALAFNDSAEIYLHILPAYERRSNLWRELEQLSKRMLKNQKNLKVWCKWLDILYRREAGALRNAGTVVLVKPARKALKNRREIQDVLQRCANSLDEKSQLQLVVHHAKLEFEYGSPEIGRSKLIEILERKPKRTDLWNVLIDAQVKSIEHKSDIIMTRQVFNKAVKAADKRLAKLKTIFQKWLDFETAHGTAASVKACQDAALQLVGQ